jgi:ankyrin repeat protein
VKEDLINKGKKPFTPLSDNEVRMLYAAQYGDMETLKIMINRQVSVRTRDFEGRTPLLVASAEGNLNIVQYLVHNGSPLAETDDRGNDAIAEAKRSENAEVQYFMGTIIGS